MCPGHCGTFLKSTQDHLQINQRRVIPCCMSSWYPLNRASLVAVNSNILDSFIWITAETERCHCTPLPFGGSSSVRWDIHIFSTFDTNQISSAYSFQHRIKWQCYMQRTEHSFGCFSILFLASFSSLSTEFLSPNLVMMTKKLPGCERALSSLSPSLPFSSSCNNCQLFLLMF